MSAQAEKKVSKACIIRNLQSVVGEKQQQYDQLLLENQSLRTREVSAVMAICMTAAVHLNLLRPQCVAFFCC